MFKKKKKHVLRHCDRVKQSGHAVCCNNDKIESQARSRTMSRILMQSFFNAVLLVPCSGQSRVAGRRILPRGPSRLSAQGSVAGPPDKPYAPERGECIVL